MLPEQAPAHPQGLITSTRNLGIPLPRTHIPKDRASVNGTGDVERRLSLEPIP